MALEVTGIAQYDSNNTEVSGRINNGKKSNSIFADRFLNWQTTLCRNASEVRKVQSAGTKIRGYVNVGVDDRSDANNDYNVFNTTARSKSDNIELSWKVIRIDNNIRCKTERGYDTNECSNRYAEEIDALVSNNRPLKCTTRLDERVIGMIEAAHSSDNNKITKIINNESVLIAGRISSAEVAARNAQNLNRRNDDRFTVGATRGSHSFDSVTSAQNNKVHCCRDKKKEEGKMSLIRDSADIEGSNYLRNNCSSSSSAAYKNSTRTSRSAESTPDTGTGTKTIIGRDKSPPARPRCKLNENNCLSLSDILRSFNGPVSEEQAWALCYQCAKCFKAALHPQPIGPEAPTRNERLYDVTELAHVLLHKDGDVHSTTIRDPPLPQPDSREPLTSEHKLVFSLGLIVFGALDFGLDEEEERRVAPDLEALITLMTQPEDDSEVEDRLQETDDEGIERDSGESEDDPLHQMPDGHGVHPGYIRRTTPPLGLRPPAQCSVNTVLQLCTRHLQGTQEQADTHYKAVVRALVAEALELSHFLEKVAADKQGNSTSSAGVTGERHLDTLDFSDWARFWVQVIGELRRGVKLKKVEGSIGGGGSTGPGNIGSKRVRGTGRGIEFELTPYEILMDDIRARRYRLRKTPSPSPHLRKDAHAVILDFIRSRPPLKKASERKLPPLKRQSTPRELLMESIKRPPRPLRPSSSNKKIPTECSAATPSRDSALGTGTRDDGAPSDNAELVTTPKSSRRESADLNNAPRCQPRRLIIPLDFKLDGDDDDDDDVVTRFDDDGSDSWRDDGDDEDFDEDNGGQRGRAAYDLATQCPSRRVASRRHTVVGATGAGLGSGAGTLSLPHSRPHSRQQDPRNRNDSAGNPKPKDRPLLDPELPSSINSSQDELAQEKSPNKGNASIGNMFLDDRLSLTLEEIVHIRSVLTKAELESLPVEGRVKEDVEKRRVCFLCLKTRFGILGPWGQRCRLCERTVCVKCYSKMRIPTEHFAHVPVVLLSPSLMLSPPSEVDGKDYSSPSHGTVRSLWPRPAGGVGSAPASPASKRRDPTLRNTTPTPTPTPSVASSSHHDEDGAACSSLPPSNNSPAAGSTQTLDRSRRFYCSSANSSPARTSASSSRYGAGDLRVAERLRGVAMVVCHDCRIMVLQIIKSSRTTRATIRNNVISRLTLNLSPIYV